MSRGSRTTTRRRRLPLPLPLPHQGQLWLAMALALVGCNHDWDPYDPRLSTGGSGATTGAGSTGSGAGSTGSGGGGSATTASTGAGGGGGDAGTGGAGTGGAGGGEMPECGPTGLFPMSDAFDDGMIDNDWLTFEDGVATVTETGGLLVLGLPDASSGRYGGVLSAGAHPFAGSAAFVEVDEVADPTTHAYTHFSVTAGNDVGYVEIVEEFGTLFFKRVVGGSGGTPTYLADVAYDPAVHRYWRIRECGGRVYWETSPDAQSWEIHANEPAAIPLSSVQVGLGVGTYQPEPKSPGGARFEGFNVEP